MELTNLFFWLLRRGYRTPYNVRARALEELAEAARLIRNF